MMDGSHQTQNYRFDTTIWYFDFEFISLQVSNHIDQKVNDFANMKDMIFRCSKKPIAELWIYF